MAGSEIPRQNQLYDFLAWEDELPRDVSNGLLDRSGLMSSMRLAEANEALQAFGDMSRHFRRLGATSENHIFHSVPLEDGFLRVAITPSPKFKKYSPSGRLFRVSVNFFESNPQDLSGKQFRLIDHIVSPLSMSLTRQETTLAYAGGIHCFEQPPCTPPIIWANPAGHFKLHESRGYHVYPPLYFDKMTSPIDIQQNRVWANELNNIFAMLSDVTRELAAKDFSHQPESE